MQAPVGQKGHAREEGTAWGKEKRVLGEEGPHPLSIPSPPPSTHVEDR